MQRFCLFTGSRSARLGLLVVALMGAATIGVDQGAARDAFVAGGRSTDAIALDDMERRDALDRAGRVARALGLPTGVRRIAVRLDDRFDGTIVDEVTAFDAADRPIAIVRSTPDGRLRTAVRLGWSDASGTLTGAAAARRARELLGAAGVRPAGRPVSAPDRSGRGWTVAWPRIVDGVPVLGDGTWVRLWPDGTVHSVASAEATLAAVPSTTLTEDEARRIAERQVATWSVAGQVSGTVSSLELAWAAPNDMFEPSRPDAPEAVRALVWVARVTPAGVLASRVRGIELYIDAGDGRLLGGDLLE